MVLFLDMTEIHREQSFRAIGKDRFSRRVLILLERNGWGWVVTVVYRRDSRE